MKETILFLIIAFSLTIIMAETITLGNGKNGISVLSSTENETILEYTIGKFETLAVQIDNMTWHNVYLPGEGILENKGYPQLPVFNRSIIISDRSLMKIEILDVEYQDFELPVAPSKGIIYRNVNPNTVPYVFDSIYQKDKFYPANLGELSDPYILRDYRGITIKTYPFAYNAFTKTLRVYTHYKIRIYAEGEDNRNTISVPRNSITVDFIPIYAHHFLNWEQHRYTPVNDTFGKMLVICHGNFLSEMTNFVNWKNQKGIPTELIEFSTIGTTATQLQTYIQNRYLANREISYILLVGDLAYIPSPTYGAGESDPSYSLVAGNDAYPDIFVGRFSAESTTDVITQVNKVIHYERDLNSMDSWVQNAFGIGSSSGIGDDGEYDYQHINNIKQLLIAYGYNTVDEIYYDSATASQVTNAINAGRGFGNYCGHGSTINWDTTGFNINNVNALSNGYMTPFIMSVACLNGHFGSNCFAEAWLRKSGGGAIAFYGSSINQSWNPPMEAQDEVTNLLVAEAKTTIGGLFFNGCCSMIDVYGTEGVNIFRTWNIFGDPSLLVRTKTPTPMTVTHPATIYSGSTSIIVSTGISKALVSITYNNCIYGRGYTNAAGTVSINLINAPLGNLSYTITVTGFNCITYIGVINQIIPNIPWMTVSSVVYDDDNNDIPEFNESGFFDVTFSNVGSANATNLSCVLSCSTAGITITHNTITIPFLAANASTIIDNAFALSIADNIANGTEANFTITMTIGGYPPWTYEFFRIISAPALQFGNITIYDPTGNNNGRLDPGETVTISLLLNNIGGSVSPSGTATMSCSDSGITINNGYAVFSSIPASGNTTLSFNLTASASLTIGTLITLNFNATAGAYTVNKLEPITLGLILEDFETGNFNAFGWTMGTYPWTIDSSTYHSGNYAARSGSITHSQSSTMEIIRILSSVGTLSFWYKISSEANYDFLKFSVDGIVQGSWSGTVDWTQVSFTIPAGQHTFKWAYTKDASESSGSDCAWIDDIIFPTSIAYTPPTITYSPSFFIQRLNPDQTAIQNLTIGKTGTGTLNFTVSRPSGSTTVLDESFENGGSIPSGWTQTIINGFVTWTFTTGGYNGHPASAFDGTYNARFYYGNTTSFTTKLVTPPLNLNGADIATLTFWHTQEARDGNQDQLKVYYRTSSTAPWNLITSYTNSIANWTQETINLPNLSSTYYIAFEGISHYGYGVCVDKVVVTKTLTTMISTWITVSGGGSYSGSIAYNEPAQDIPIGFNSVGLSPSTYTTNLTIYSNDALHPSITIPINLIVSQTSLPIIVINPLAINFGTVAINSNVQEQFSIQNTGTAILSGNISTPEGYTVSDATLKDSKGTLLSGYNDYPRNTLSYSINPGSSKIYNLIFSPVSATTYSGNVVITSNDPNNPTLNIAVTGSGYIPNIPPIVTISNSAAGLVLSWNEIPHATQYQIYRSTLSPYEGFELIASITELQYVDSEIHNQAFYYVIAISTQIINQ
jgi:hypothetical protein